MDGVEAKPVDAIIAQPHQRIVDEETMHRIDIDRHRATQGGVDILVKEGAGIGIEVIPVRTEVVVHHVEKDGDAQHMRGVDQRLQLGRRTISLGHGIGQDTVIAPVARTAESNDRQQLDRGDTRRR